MRTIRKIEFSPARTQKTPPAQRLRRTIKIHQEKSVNAWVLPNSPKVGREKRVLTILILNVFPSSRIVGRKTARSRREEINTRNLISSLRMMPPLVLIMKIYLPNPKSHYDFHAPKFFNFSLLFFWHQNTHFA